MRFGRPLVAAFASILLAVIGLLALTGGGELESTADAPPAVDPVAGLTSSWRNEVKATHDGLDALYVDPKPEAVEQYVTADCECRERFVAALATLKAAGQRFESPPTKIKSIELVESQPNAVRVRIAATADRSALVDAQGKVVSAPRNEEVLLFHIYRRGSDGRWLLSSDAALGINLASPVAS